ncbi:MAG: helix-turn-helix transcriptional regulator [Lachnospiraceae bacterium]|nr:helix-turn-helix transcriptional regulator [Lachnospiraceae bacterium]
MNIQFFKDNLKKKLKEQKITLSSLAIQADLSEDTLRSIIYGKSQDIKLSTMVKIADVLNCTLDNLIGRSIYSSEQQDFIDRMQNISSHSFRTLKAVLAVEESINLTNSYSGKKIIQVLTPLGNLKDGHFFNSASYEPFDISGYPKVLQQSVDFGLRITSDYFEPIYYLNDILLISRRNLPEYHDVVLYIDINKRMYIRQFLETGLSPINHFGKRIPYYKQNDYTPLGVIVTVAQEFNIEQYR